MKVFILLLSLTAVALASLEPPGYRSPGTASQYLPPHLHHHQHRQQHHHRSHHQSSQPGSSSPLPSSRYLPPNLTRPVTDPPAGPSTQYLPPRRKAQNAPIPSSNYLPAADKPPGGVPSLTAASPPSGDYLPPPPPPPTPPSTAAAIPAHEYLPPLTRPRPSNVPVNEYLPPGGRVSPPSNDYLPPLPTGRQSTTKPPKIEYLPPKNDYLPPTRQRTTPPLTGSRIGSASTVYKLDNPTTYPKPPKFPGPVNIVAPASPPISTTYKKQSKYSSGLSAGKSFEQPADNYPPPYDTSASGYRYGVAGAGGARVDQATVVPAKYDFEYRVSDEFGNDYSHKESRAGAQIQGFYSVLLPDGRKQIVRYEADEDGFKPRISYEDSASVLGPKAVLTGDASGVNDDGFSGYDKNANGIDASHRAPY